MSAVTDNKSHHRFELEVDGHVATEHYKLDGNVITFEHTEVPTELGGKGVGSKLVQGALDQVRAAGLKLIPQCPFVKAWINKHPDYQDLVKV
ncbi:N-acetyltransferase [Bradyrhizobium manausense]|uniref:GNAT family N-acetyltransferase n=1 Tax=Bradyrhizobium TaxID=374 RepID=UPI001BABDFC5|nr:MULTISPECIES: GNAT family N-acetyltransferase [Bradyrhizobium]MBR0828284.1 N-acetyltransferase [Bradyrhizobium manausense]UVO25640.1 N-acetyltransferase [Bradyrhizobium arachidis]